MVQMVEEDDPYAQVARGKLTLKKDAGIKKKKKKKDKKILEQVTKTIETTETTEPKQQGSSRTKAEMAFKRMQEKMVNTNLKGELVCGVTFSCLQQTKRILEKASMTHKERVEKFNQHLDSLTEHFDIPKVSWTK